MLNKLKINSMKTTQQIWSNCPEKYACLVQMNSYHNTSLLRNNKPRDLFRCLLPES